MTRAGDGARGKHLSQAESLRRRSLSGRCHAGAAPAAPVRTNPSSFVPMALVHAGDSSTCRPRSARVVRHRAELMVVRGSKELA